MNLLDVVGTGTSIFSYLDIDHQRRMNLISTRLTNVRSEYVQKRFWIRHNHGMYQPNEIEIELLEEIQKGHGFFQSDAKKNRLYHVLVNDYIEYQMHGLVNYTVYKQHAPEAWVYVSVSDQQILPIPYGSYGPLPSGTEYRSFLVDHVEVYRSEHNGAWTML
jgi:hypothetical protein